MMFWSEAYPRLYDSSLCWFLHLVWSAKTHNNGSHVSIPDHLNHSLIYSFNMMFIQAYHGPGAGALEGNKAQITTSRGFQSCREDIEADR